MKRFSHLIFQWMLFFCFYLIGQTNYAANFYWRAIASDGNLNNMANWELNASGSNIPATGAPGPGDNVFFTVESNKQTLTPSGEFNCNNMTFSPGLSYISNLNNIYNIYGSLTGNGSITFSSATLQFNSTGAATIDMGVSTQKITGGAINFRGSGTYSLTGNDLLTSATINFTTGNFNSNGKTMGANIINIPNPAAIRTLDFSNSEIRATSFGAALTPNNDLNTSTTRLVYTAGNIFRIDYGSSSGRTIQFKSITFAATPINGAIQSLQNGAKNNILIVEDLTLNNKALKLTGTTDGATVKVTGTLFIPEEYDISSDIRDVILEVNAINSPISPCGSRKSFTNRSAGKFELKSLGSEIITSDIAFKGITFSGAGFKAPISNDLGQNTGSIDWTTAIPSITYYWIGGTGNWNDPTHWSTSSNGAPTGCIPTGNDNVIFDAASFTAPGQTVTVDAFIGYCKNITWTDPAKEGKLIGTKQLGVLGSADYTGCGGINISIDYLGGGTIKSGGVVYTSPLINFMQEQTYSLLDDLITSTTATSININSGTFISNGKKISAYKIISTSLPTTATRTIDMSNSEVSVAYQWVLWSDSASTNFDNSHIQLINPSASFSTRAYDPLSKVNYNKVSFIATTGAGNLDVYHYASGSNSPNYAYFDKLSFNSDANVYYSYKVKDLHLIKGKTYTFGSNYNVYITGGIYTSGSECDLAIIKTSVAGTRGFFHKSEAPFITEGVNIKDIAATASVPLTVDGGVDGGNNLNVTVNAVTGRDMYWVGGTGDWSDAFNHWSIGVSGGNPAITNASGCIPRSIDNVIFDNNSFSGTSDAVKLDIDGQCNNMTWTAAAGAKTPTFIGNTKKLTVDGSIDLALGTKFNDRFDLYINGNRTIPITQYINTHKASLPLVYIYFVGSNRFELKDDLTVSYFEINSPVPAASFYTNGYAINSGYVRSYSSGILDISGSTITCTGASSGYWNFAGSKAGAKFNSENSIILNAGYMGIYVPLNDTAQFNSIKFTTATNNVLSNDPSYPGRTNIRRVEFIANSSIVQTDLSIDTLIYGRATTNSINAGRTLIVNDTLIGYGTKCNPLVIQSSTTTQATLKSGKCNIDIPFGMIKNVIADLSGGCTSEGYHVLANDAGALQNSPGWSVSTLGALSLLGNDTTIVCADFDYIQTTKETLGVGEKYEWFYNGQPYGGNTDTIHIKKPGVYSLKIEYAPGCFIDESATRRVFGLEGENPPVITCPGDKTVTVNSDGCSYKVSDTSLDPYIAITTCEFYPGIQNTWYELSGVTVADSTSATTLQNVVFNKGVTTVTWYAEDYMDIVSCSFTVTVNSDVTITASSDVEICEDGATTLTVSGADSYQWSPSAGLSATTGASVEASPSVTTIYTVIGTDLFGCSDTTTVKVTVNPSPNAGTITGNNAVCIGSTTQLDNSIAGGTWSSEDNSIATISATGVVTGVTAGTVEIKYTVTNASGCTGVATITITVNELPDAGTITGNTSLCVGSTETLSNNIAGGTWSSEDNSIATVSATGVVTGVTAGTVEIKYTVTNANGCTSFTTTTITVNELPDAGTITGDNALCVGSTTQLSNNIAGGTWSSEDNSIATINSTGVVTGVAAGTVEIKYTVTNANGCTSIATLIMTVNDLPDAGTITGNNAICVGSTTQLSNNIAGGTWSSTDNSIATISAAGLVSGVTAGTVEIQYTVSNANGCINVSTMIVTVNALPDAGTIAGTTGIVEIGQTLSLSVTGETGGTWSTDDSSIASITSTGDITGNALGTTTISYSVTNAAGCSQTITIQIEVVDNFILTASSDVEICEGDNAPLTAEANGAVSFEWTSNDGSFTETGASVTASPTVTTVYTVKATNTYGTEKEATITVTVNALPDAGLISEGNSFIYVSNSKQLTASIAGGIWSSDRPSIAVVDATGKVTGVSPGTATILYTVIGQGGCSSTVSTIITVRTFPTPPPVDPVNPTPVDPVDPKPEPEKPEAGIKLESGQIICAEDQTATISVEILHKGELQYILRFSAEAHAVGIQDMVTYQSLPLTGTVSFNIPANTPSGTYKGTLIIKGDTSSNLITDYPFTFDVLVGAKITKQPMSVTNICDTDNFTLKVEAMGDELTYQWYLNDQKIEGANESTYKGKLSVQTEGTYKVEVISTCGRVFSDEAIVSGGALRILIKWDDVLYVINTDNKYVSFQWYKDNVAINPYGTAVYYTDEKNGLNGTYKVRAFKADGSYDESCEISFTTTTKSASVSVYPNPVQRNASVSVQIGELNGNGVINIFDMGGRKLYTGQTTGVNTQIPMDVPAGTYVMQITLESGKVVTRKLVVK